MRDVIFDHLSQLGLGERGRRGRAQPFLHLGIEKEIKVGRLIGWARPSSQQMLGAPPLAHE